MNDGDPGLYSVIIGISRYPHFDGGGQPAPETHGLGQLHNSAQTAARVFQWLSSGFQFADLDPVWCKVLLSPTDEEAVKIRNSGLRHYGAADDASMRTALDQWTAAMPISGSAARESRTLFFFSGHGVHRGWHPVLLPSDYLKPSFGPNGLRKCLSGREFRDWMETHPVAEHIALFDACRNEGSPMDRLGVEPNTLLTPGPLGPGPRAVARFYATLPTEAAYQLPNSDLTIFGQAVLEALDGRGIQISDLDWDTFTEYVQPRVTFLIKQANRNLTQTVRPTLDPSNANLVVTSFPADRAQPSAGVVGADGAAQPDSRSVGAAPRVSHRGGGGTSEARAMSPISTPAPVRPAEALESRRGLPVLTASGAQAELERDLTEGSSERAPISSLRDFGVAHHHFGHEFLSELWVDGAFQLLSLADGQAIATSSGGAALADVRRNRSGSHVLADLMLEPGSDGVLAVFQPAGQQPSTRFAIILPRDPYTPLLIQLDIQMAVGAAISRARIEARLGPADGDDHQYLWTLLGRARFESVGVAARELDVGRLVRFVEDKQAYPTAAFAGALLLASGGRLAQVGDWTRNLMNWFPATADGPVLWAESIRAAVRDYGVPDDWRVDDPYGEMVNALAAFKERGLPFFAAAIPLAEAQVRFLRQHRARLTGPQRRVVESIRRRLERLLRATRPSGQFIELTRASEIGKTHRPMTNREMLEMARPAPST